LDCAIVVGTRPEIVKMAPVVKACAEQHVPFYILHTGQHYDYNLDGSFFQALELPQPKYNLCVGSGPHGGQTGKILERMEQVFAKERPAMVLVQGDTNSVLAGGLVATKMHIPIGHVEAGLRSYDREMPEEVNRVVVDHIGTHLFAPTAGAKENLLSEGIEDEKTYVTGNTIADVVLDLLERGKVSESRLKPFGLRKSQYVLITAHRAENVDDPERLQKLIRGIAAVAQTHSLTAFYPCHPRTQARLKSFGTEVSECVRVMDPIGLFDFLALERFARIILTDSGGVQEEACIYGVPCVTLRNTTERPETVSIGANVLAGVDPDAVAKAAAKMLGKKGNWEHPFGDGTAGQQIASLVAPLIA